MLSLTGLGPSFSPSKAAQACTACRKQKRRCDKTLPECSLCVRMHRPCDYTEIAAPAPTAEDFAALQMKLVELESRLDVGGAVSSSGIGVGIGVPAPGSAPGSNGSVGVVDEPAPVFSPTREQLWQGGVNQFPSTVFLDMDAYRWLNLTVPKPTVEIPSEVLEYLGDGPAVQDAVTDYFARIHPWMPIVSKKRMNLGIPLWDGGPDLAMLFLAIKLITTQPADGVAPSTYYLYTASKRFLALLESSGSISIMNLQATILVALYEYSHAIYPSAWMTVGACVKYIDFLGLPGYKDSSSILGQCTTWTEAEERRRAFWATIVLDRLICMGNKRRFMYPDPPENEVLPVNDQAWDEGAMDRAGQRSLSEPFAEKQPPFARLCEAAILAGRAQQHVRAADETRKHSGRIDATTAEDLVSQLTNACAVLQQDMADALGATATSFAPSPPLPGEHGNLSLRGRSQSQGRGQHAASTGNSPASSGQSGHAITEAQRTAALAYVAPQCVAISALIMIFDFYCCPGNVHDPLERPRSSSELSMQVQAVEGLRDCSSRVVALAEHIYAWTHDRENISAVSPLALDAFYCAASTFDWLMRESGDVEAEKSLAVVKRMITRVSLRWRLAAEYVHILEQQDITILLTLKGGA